MASSASREAQRHGPGAGILRALSPIEERAKRIVNYDVDDAHPRGQPPSPLTL